MTGTHTQRLAHTPLLPASQLGIMIAPEPRRDGPPLGQHARPAITGTYRLPRDEADAFGAGLLSRLGVVAQRDHRAELAMPFGGRLLFADDTIAHSGAIEGAFRIDIAEAFEGRLSAGSWMLFAVLGVHVSSPIELVVQA